MKTIKTKRMMTMVANAVEKSINEEMGHYSDLKIEKKSYNDFFVFEITQYKYFFMLADYVQAAFKAVNHYTETYKGVWMTIDTKPFYVVEQDTFLHQPVIVIHVDMDK